MHQRIFEGKWKEVELQAAELDGDSIVRLEVFEPVKGEMMRFGMFPGLLKVTDEDFRKAEWHIGDEEI